MVDVVIFFRRDVDGDGIVFCFVFFSRILFDGQSELGSFLIGRRRWRRVWCLDRRQKKKKKKKEVVTK